MDCAQTWPRAVVYGDCSALQASRRGALTLTIQYDEIGRKLVAGALLHRLAGRLPPDLGVEGVQDDVARRGAMHQGQVDAIRPAERRGTPRPRR